MMEFLLLCIFLELVLIHGLLKKLVAKESK